MRDAEIIVPWCLFWIAILGFGFLFGWPAVVLWIAAGMLGAPIALTIEDFR